MHQSGVKASSWRIRTLKVFELPPQRSDAFPLTIRRLRIRGRQAVIIASQPHKGRINRVERRMVGEESTNEIVNS
jgi:hypothetical protein